MDTRVELLPPESWKFIEVSMANGVGLTVACEGMNISVKAMSEFLAKSPGTLDKLKQECVMGFKSIMTMTNNGAAEQKLATWNAGHQALKEFVKRVNLWEQHCKAQDVTPQKISEAFYTYTKVEEVATVVGFTVADFYAYILSDVNLKTYLITSRFIKG